ncbi:MAG: ATP synthase F0 subunit B [Spirochaetaceae bacterium]|jgi:F-type H+-transporting ATPase subunit b|nr:ATP synthase F0 subunit B [Spirochaetaceae bacterium]
MNLIDFSVTFLFTILNIALLCFVLRAVLFKPVSRIIEARKEKIQNDIDTAAADREEAKRLCAEYEEKVNGLEDEARKITAETRLSAEERAAAIIAEGKAQADALIEAARKQIAAEKQTAYIVFKAEAAALVMRAASRLLGREITGEDARYLSETAINEFSSSDRGRPS